MPRSWTTAPPADEQSHLSKLSENQKERLREYSSEKKKQYFIINFPQQAKRERRMRSRVLGQN